MSNFQVPFSAVISVFPLSFSSVPFVTVVGGNHNNGLMLILENGRLSIECSLAGGMRDKLQLVRESILFFRFQFQAEKKNRMLSQANSKPVH